MKKKPLFLSIILTLLSLITVGSTWAYLISASNPVENTFTYGKVDITLTESTGDKYNIIPAATIKKDPAVTVKGGSETCWAFVQITQEHDFDMFMTYELAEGWQRLAGYVNVYYRLVEKSDHDVSFGVLKDNKVSVSAKITEEMLEAVKVNPKLNFKAYAVQTVGFETVNDAFAIIKGMEE